MPRHREVFLMMSTWPTRLLGQHMLLLRTLYFTYLMQNEGFQHRNFRACAELCQTFRSVTFLHKALEHSPHSCHIGNAIFLCSSIILTCASPHIFLILTREETVLGGDVLYLFIFSKASYFRIVKLKGT